MRTNLLRAFWWALRVVIRDARTGRCHGDCNQGRTPCTRNCMKVGR